NVVAVDDIRARTNMQVVPVVAAHDDVVQAIARYCRSDAEMSDLQEELSEAEVSIDESVLSGITAEDDAPIVRFVNLLISQAIQDRASDIHIEPNEKDLRVRYR